LAEVGEFGLIDRLASAWENGRRLADNPLSDTGVAKPGRKTAMPGPPGLRLGIGDDAAAIDIPAGKTLLTTTDMLVEGVHFLWSESGARTLGRKAMAANISDIAAMGGLPGWAFLSIGVPPAAAVEEVEDLYRGMGEMAGRFGVNLAGGDTVRSGKWVINVALLGIALREPITRRGGRPGDLIMVTGSVGDSAAGLQLLTNPGAAVCGLSGEDRQYLLGRHLDPLPRVGEAMALADYGGVTAMIDVSDGVASEIHHICRNSGCGAEVDLGSLPVSPQAVRLARALKEPAFHWALYGGEDYELLFTASPADAPGLISSVGGRTGTPVSVIGRLTEAGPGIIAVFPGQTVVKREPLAAKGFNHFA
jgi:thiamine-monophosphate kinase